MKWNQLSVEYIQSRSEKVGDCWLWRGYIQSSGYGQVYVEGTQKLAHRLSWLACHGTIDDKLLVLHKCDTPACVNPAHLFLGTAKDNSQDCITKNRQCKDYSFTRKRRIRKLNDKQVFEILKSKASLEYLSKKYSISKSLVSNIRNRKRKQLVTG